MDPDQRPLLTVYFDGACPLCTAETTALKDSDPSNALRLVDCSGAAFVDADVTAADIPRSELLRIIHARDADGRWLRGVEVYEAMYRIAGFEAIARLWAHPWLRPLWNVAYPWMARHRMLLSRLGAIKVYGWLVRGKARRNASAACDTAGCRAGTSREPLS